MTEKVFVIVVFPDHTHLLFLAAMQNSHASKYINKDKFYFVLYIVKPV